MVIWRNCTWVFAVNVVNNPYFTPKDITALIGLINIQNFYNKRENPLNFLENFKQNLYFL